MPIKASYLLLLLFTSLSIVGNAQDVNHPESIRDAKRYLSTSPDSTRYYLNQILSHKSEQSEEYQAEIFWVMGEMHKVRSRFDSALFYYQKGTDFATKKGQFEQVAINNLGQGNTLLSLGKLSSAQEKFTEALAYFEENNMSAESAAVYTSMGFLFQRSNDLAKARQCYDEALSRSTEPNNNLLINLATWHGRRNQPDSALMIYNELLANPEIESDLLLLARIHLNGAIIYDQLRNHEKVVAYSSKALKYNEQLGNLKSMGVTYQNLTQYHFLRGEYDRSRVCLDSGYYCAKEVGDLNVFIKLLGIEVEFEKLGGNYKKAEWLMEKYDFLKDSLYRERQESLVQELNIKYETATNKQQIAELQLVQKDTALSLSKSKNQRNLFISGFALVLIVAGFLYYLYQTKKKTSDILSHKNEQISESLAEREILLKEIHHRVKNNLQVISSLLYLQAGSLEDEAAIDAVRQGQHRVEAMGLIHQRLYTADDVRGVDIQGYFEQLCEEVITVFGKEDSEIDFVVNTNGLKLDIDTVIPLGLIVNELITNAIKYAFEGKEEGNIDIYVDHDGKQLSVKIKDDGIGMNEEALRKVNSFGWKMMRSLSRKLKAQITIKNDKGTTVELIADRYKLVK